MRNFGICFIARSKQQFETSQFTAKVDFRNFFLQEDQTAFFPEGFFNLHCIITKTKCYILILTQKVPVVSHSILIKPDAFLGNVPILPNHYYHIEKCINQHHSVTLEFNFTCSIGAHAIFFFLTFYRLNFVHWISKVFSQ